MKIKEIIIKSLKQSFLLPKKHPYIFALLFTAQLLFVAGTSAGIVVGGYKAMAYANNVVDYLASMTGSDQELAEKMITGEGMFGEDPLLLYENVMMMLKTAVFLFLFIFLIYYLLNGWAWSLTNRIISRKSGFIAYRLKFLAIIFGYFAAISLIVYIAIKSKLSDIPTLLSLKGMFYLLLILPLLYFMYISLALIGKMSLKKAFRNAFILGVKKMHILLPLCLFNIAVSITFLFLSFTVAELHIFLVALTMVSFILAVTWTRIFFVLVVDKLKV